MKTIAIIGSGSWGAALAMHLAKLGNKVKLWAFCDEDYDSFVNKNECRFLPGIKMPENIEVSLEYEDVINGSDMILHVTPSKFTRENIKKYKPYVTDQPIIMCSKGFELSTLSTLDEIVKEEIPSNKIAVLSGPSHAEEVSIGIPTAVVVASEDSELLSTIQNTFSSPSLRIYTSKDVKGVELGGSLKNIIAFCAGITKALDLGDNTLAALITRGLAEISRLGVKMGGQRDTFYGLTGLGDLIVTCGSEHSRNRKAGFLIGQGKTLEETRKEVGMTIESIDNIEVAHILAEKYDVDMPIVNTVYDVLYNNLDPREALTILMTRKLKTETEN